MHNFTRKLQQFAVRSIVRAVKVEKGKKVYSEDGGGSEECGDSEEGGDSK